MSGGCAPFEVIAQNRYAPYGAAIRTQPNALSTKVGSYGNSVISVNGWVGGTADYPTNPRRGTATSGSTYQTVQGGSRIRPCALTR